MMNEGTTRSRPSTLDATALLLTAIRAGTVAGLAMVPFAAVFRGLGWRVNEYGRKVLELAAGDIASPLREVLMFVQHIGISWAAAFPFLFAVGWMGLPRRGLLAAGLLYGGAFYVAINSLALPFAFGDPTPWQLGFLTVTPSLTIHLVYGLVLGWMAPVTRRS